MSVRWKVNVFGVDPKDTVFWDVGWKIVFCRVEDDPDSAQFLFQFANGGYHGRIHQKGDNLGKDVMPLVDLKAVGNVVPVLTVKGRLVNVQKDNIFLHML